MSLPEVVQSFLQAHPEIEVFEAFIVDVNGILRGKWVPRENVKKIFGGEFRLPRSAFALDIWGQDVFDAGLALDAGDPDGACMPVIETLAPVPWADRPTAQVLMTMMESEARPFYGDPRHVLSNVAERLAALGLTPVVAGELEFYLIDGKPTSRGGPQPPRAPASGRRSWATQIYGIAEAREFEPVLAEMHKACVQQGVPCDAAFRENGPCQFEINLNHVPDPLGAADHMVLLKRAVKSVSRRHGMDATFMAKPYGERSGNGTHLHISLLDEHGDNVFAGADGRPTERLGHAVGGTLATMADAMAVFAANANSYRRFQAESHAPTKATWGFDNRTAAVRIPSGKPEATRIEHRVAGADANPYLTLAAVLAGIHLGLVNEIDPGEPAAGNAYLAEARSLPTTWDEALRTFAASSFVEEYLGAAYRRLYVACKEQEKSILNRHVSDCEFEAYLRSL